MASGTPRLDDRRDFAIPRHLRRDPIVGEGARREL
jgi:hypothetical protein